MLESKQQALEKNGWKFGSANEFLRIEKLDFGFLQYDDVLEAYTYDQNDNRNGHVHIFYSKKFFVVSAYLDKTLYEIKDNCKDIYEALDVANQWYNSIKTERI